MQETLTDEPIFSGLININRSEFSSLGRLAPQQKQQLSKVYQEALMDLKHEYEHGEIFSTAYYFDAALLYWRLGDRENLQNHLQVAVQLMSKASGEELVSSWKASGIMGFYLQSLVDIEYDFDPGETFAAFRNLQENMMPDIRLQAAMGQLFWNRGNRESALNSWLAAIRLGIQSLWTTTSFFDSIVVPFNGILTFFIHEQDENRMVQTVTQIQQLAHDYSVDLKPLFVTMNQSNPDLLAYLESTLNKKIQVLKKARNQRQ